MADRNESEAGPEARPDLFKWHGTEVIFIPLMLATGILGNALVLYITHFRWENKIFNFFIKVGGQLCSARFDVSSPVHYFLLNVQSLR